LAEWVQACQAQAVPMLAMSEGCQALVGGRPGSGSSQLLRVQPLPDTAGDDVFGDVPGGSLWPVTAGDLPESPDGTAVLLADADGRPVAARGAGPVYLTSLAPYRRAGDLAEHLPDLADTISAAARFLDALGAALLGRWVDNVVGRTDAEAPWGRKGPQPVARPGLYLNPV
jgi:hypothetical protein